MLEKQKRNSCPPNRSATNSVNSKMSDLLDVDWLCKNQSGVLLLELFQGGAEEHQHRRQLQLQDCLMDFDLCSTHTCEAVTPG